MAAYKTTLSVGYEKSTVNNHSSRLDENPTGMNGKIRMEINDDWGVMLSLTILIMLKIIMVGSGTPRKS